MMAAQREYDWTDFEVALRRASRYLAQASELGVALNEYEVAAQLLDQQVELVELAGKVEQRPIRLIPAAEPAKRGQAAG